MIQEGYKQTEIGVIPEDWEVKAWNDVSFFDGGLAFSSTRFKNSGEYQVIKMANLYNGKLDLERNISFINNLFLSEEKSLAQKTDILISLTGTTGKKDYGFTVYVDNNKKLVINQRVGRIKNKIDSNNKYIYYFTKSTFFDLQFYELSKGGTGNQTNVSISDLKSVQIPLPPLPEQEAIAEALSDCDAWIESLEQLLTKKRLIKQGAMQELLGFGSAQPPNSAQSTINLRSLSGAEGNNSEVEGNVSNQATSAVERSRNWEMKKLGEVCEVKKGQLITSEMKINGTIPVIAGGKTPAYYHNKANRYGKTITISASGASAGYVSFHDYPIFASDCSTIIESERYIIEFIFYFLLRNQDVIYSYQTGGAQPHIHPKDIEPMLIPIPSLTEQTRIATILSDMDEEIEDIENQLAKARQIKQGMMQELLTGRIRLVETVETGHALSR